MNQTDIAAAKQKGHNDAQESKPSKPPNDHGTIYFFAFASKEEVKADTAYREGYKEGQENRKSQEQ